MATMVKNDSATIMNDWTNLLSMKDRVNMYSEYSYFYLKYFFFDSLHYYPYYPFNDCLDIHFPLLLIHSP